MTSNDPTKFVNELLTRKDFSDRRNAIASQAKMEMAVGGLTLLVCLVYYVRERSQPPVTALEEVRDRIWDVRRKQLFADMSTACIALLFAYQMYARYTPTNSEVSTAILIKYLRLKNVLDPQVYDVLKGLKPYRMETLKL